MPYSLFRYVSRSSDSNTAVALRVGTMAGNTAEFCEQLFASHSQGLVSTAPHPGFVIFRLHHDHGPDHPGVHGSAIFSAEEVICARLGRVKPGYRVAARKHVLLNAERGDEEAVNDVLRGHDHLDIASNRHMEFVDLALTFHVLELPHPLLGDGVDLGGILGRLALLEAGDCAPGKEDHENAERNQAPGNLERVRAIDLLGALAGPLAVAHGEDQNQGENGNGHHPRHDQQEDVQGVDVIRHGRGPFGPKRHRLKHNYVVRPAPGASWLGPRRIITKMRVPINSMVATPARRSTRRMVALYFPCSGS